MRLLPVDPYRFEGGIPAITELSHAAGTPLSPGTWPGPMFFLAPDRREDEEVLRLIIAEAYLVRAMRANEDRGGRYFLALTPEGTIGRNLCLSLLVPDDDEGRARLASFRTQAQKIFRDHPDLQVFHQCRSEDYDLFEFWTPRHDLVLDVVARILDATRLRLERREPTPAEIDTLAPRERV